MLYDTKTFQILNHNNLVSVWHTILFYCISYSYYS